MRLIITEKQLRDMVRRGFPNQEISEEGDAAAAAPEAGTSSDGDTKTGMSKWESGVTRGTSNQIGVTKWSDIVDNTGTLNALSQVYYLPAKILIIADGCKYANEKAFIRILMNYKATSGTQYNLYGNASCWRNPTQLPLGNDDKILVN